MRRLAALAALGLAGCTPVTLYADENGTVHEVVVIGEAWQTVRNLDGTERLDVLMDPREVDGAMPGERCAFMGGRLTGPEGAPTCEGVDY